MEIPVLVYQFEGATYHRMEMIGIGFLTDQGLKPSVGHPLLHFRGAAYGPKECPRWALTLYPGVCTPILDDAITLLREWDYWHYGIEHKLSNPSRAVEFARNYRKELSDGPLSGLRPRD